MLRVLAGGRYSKNFNPAESVTLMKTIFRNQNYLHHNELAKFITRKLYDDGDNMVFELWDGTAWLFRQSKESPMYAKVTFFPATNTYKKVK